MMLRTRTMSSILKTRTSDVLVSNTLKNTMVHIVALAAALVFLCALLLTPYTAYAAFTNTETIFGAISNNTQTWDDASIGTANADRKVIVFIIINENGTASANDGAPTAVTIGGSSATKVADNSFANSGPNSQSVTVWTAAVPTGTTADIVASGIPAANYNGGIAVLTTTDNIDISVVHDAADIDEDSNGGSMDVNVPANGLAAGAGVTWPDYSGHTWTGLTEVDEVTDGGDNYWSVATYEAVGVQTPLSVSVSYSASVSNFVTVSFAPLFVALSRPPNNLGLVGYWSFDDGTGTNATDFSGNGNTGTLINSPSWIAGKRGTALDFDNSTNYLDFTDSPTPALSGAMSACAWVKPRTIADSSDTDIIVAYLTVSGTSPYYMALDLGGELQFAWTDDSVAYEFWETNDDAVVTNIWQHVCAVRSDGDSVILYVDGVAHPTNNTNDEAVTTTTSGRLAIGAASGFDVYYFDGGIDDVRVYNRALSSSEVVALARTGAARLGASSVDLQRGSSLAQGLVGHWTFDGKDTNWTAETTGTTADLSGEGNSGTLTNMNRRLSVDGGALGQGINFNGSNSYIDMGFDASLQVDFPYSIATWVKTPNFSTYNTLVVTDHIAGGAWLQIEVTTGKAYAGFGNWHGRLSAVSLTPDTWHHVVGVVRGANDIDVYVDGAVSNGSYDGGASTVPYGTDTARMGDDSLGNSFFPGSLDDVRIYNRELTATEAKQLYNLGQVRIQQ